MSRVEPRGQFLPDRRKQDLLLRLEVPHPPSQQKSPAASTQLIVRRLKGEQFSPSPKDRTLSWQFRPWPGVTTAKRAMIRSQWSYWHECEPRTAQQRTGAKQWRAGGRLDKQRLPVASEASGARRSPSGMQSVINVCRGNARPRTPAAFSCHRKVVMSFVPGITISHQRAREMLAQHIAGHLATA